MTTGLGRQTSSNGHRAFSFPLSVKMFMAITTLGTSCLDQSTVSYGAGTAKYIITTINQGKHVNGFERSRIESTGYAEDKMFSTTAKKRAAIQLVENRCRKWIHAKTCKSIFLHRQSPCWDCKGKNRPPPENLTFTSVFLLILFVSYVMRKITTSIWRSIVSVGYIKYVNSPSIKLPFVVVSLSPRTRQLHTSFLMGAVCNFSFQTPFPWCVPSKARTTSKKRKTLIENRDKLKCPTKNLDCYRRTTLRATDNDGF